LFGFNGLLTDYGIHLTLIILAVNYLLLIIGMIPIITYDHICFKKENKEHYESILKKYDIGKKGAAIADILVIMGSTVLWPRWIYLFARKRFNTEVL